MLDDVRNIIAEQSGRELEQVRPDSRLREDLGIDGEDWDDLQVALGRRWRIDWSEFEFKRYFVDEGFVSLVWLARRLGFAKWWPKASLRVSHVAAVVERGRWFNP